MGLQVLHFDCRTDIIQTEVQTVLCRRVEGIGVLFSIVRPQKMEKRAFFILEEIMGAYRIFLRYITLSVLGTLGVSCYILADTFFIAEGLGPDGLTALNLAIPAYNFIFGTAILLGMGGATRFSIVRGTGDRQAGEKIFRCTLCMAGAASVFFMLLGLCASVPLARLLGADGTVLEMTATYLQVLLLFAPAFILNNVLLCFVRCDGSPQMAMLGMLLGSLANIVLDYILIFPLDLGILGAVLATGISPVISLMILSLHWRSSACTLRMCRGAFDFKLSRYLLSLGLPSLVDQLAGAVVMIAFNLLILRLEGNIGVAAYGVVANLAIVITSLFTGVAQGVQPLISEHFGRREMEEVWQMRRYGFRTVLVLAAVLYGATALLAHPIAAAFNGTGNEALQAIAVRGLRLYFLANLFMAFNIMVGMWFTSVEQPRPAQILSLLRGCILILPIAFGLAHLWGMTGVWLALPVTEALAALLGWWMLAKGDKLC